ncbi:MAG: hypothetical protein RSE57_00050 [Clostridia bacterium]
MHHNLLYGIYNREVGFIGKLKTKSIMDNIGLPNTNVGANILADATRIANAARANPSDVNTSAASIDIQFDKTTQVLNADGSKVRIGPLKINATNCTTGVNVEVTNGVNCTMERNGNEIYFWVNTDEKKPAIDLKFTSTTSGISGGIYSYQDEGGKLGDGTSKVSKEELPASQRFCAVFPYNTPVYKSYSVPLDLPKRKVYVKHVDVTDVNMNDPAQVKNLGKTYKSKLSLDKIASDKQIEMLNALDNPGWVSDKIRVLSNIAMSAPNGRAPDGSPLRDNYPEFYRYRPKSVMQISRSTTYALAGQKYEYKGAMTAKGTSLFSAENNIALSGNFYDSSTSYVKTGTPLSGSDDYTVVVCFYSKTTLPEPIPDINIFSKDYSASSTGNPCETIFTPSNRDIQPYITAPKFCLQNLKYDLQGDPTKPNYGKYQLTNFVVNKLTNGEYNNKSDPEKSAKGRIIGSINDRATLFVGNGNGVVLNLTKQFDDEIQSITNNYYKLVKVLPTEDEIEKNFGIKGNQNITKRADFNSWYNIPMNRYNGLRQGSGIATYVEYDVLKNITSSVKKNVDTKNKRFVDVYTPLQMGKVTVSSDTIVNHTEDSSTNINNVIQKNANFDVNIEKPVNSSMIYTGLNTNEFFLDYYYLMFDFDIITTVPTIIRDLNTGKESTIRANEKIDRGIPIKIVKSSNGTTKFSAKATSDQQNVDYISNSSNRLVIVGVSKNMPETDLNDYILQKEILNQESKILKDTANTINTTKYINNAKTINWPVELTSQNVCNPSEVTKKMHSDLSAKTSLTYTSMAQDAYYFIRNQVQTDSIGRVYDFKITDSTDLNFKDVFKKPSSNNKVNDLTGNVYFSGVKRLKIYTEDINTITDRDDIYVPNSSIRKIMPLGPYKHVSGQYIQAPKMGYRISFDLKTSGMYDSKSVNKKEDKRRIEIKPSYYYVSKSGEFKDNIELYYKDSKGKYKKFKDSGYAMSFKPNDGYRYLASVSDTPITEDMSNKLESLDISKKFEITDNMMAYSDNKFIQTWFGEFKLPNSTIAVGSGGSINNPLKNGYIGVKFDIVCVSGTNGKIRVSYNINDKNKEKQGQQSINTTEWDYEGYLGIKAGETADNQNLMIQLENGEFRITSQAQYEKIRGTVALFDLDNRAADDFE